MSNDQLRAALELFNEKAEKLLGLSFTKGVKKEKTGLSISSKRTNDGAFVATSERRGPNSESIDTFVLTLRFFLQENEKCSFSRMADFYEFPHVSSAFKSEFNQIRIATNQFLDSIPTDLRIEFGGKFMTRREIIETVIYGDLAHANTQKRHVHKSWTKCEISKNVLDYVFVFIVSRLTLPIREVRDLNLKVLATL